MPFEIYTTSMDDRKEPHKHFRIQELYAYMGTSYHQAPQMTLYHEMFPVWLFDLSLNSSCSWTFDHQLIRLVRL